MESEAQPTSCSKKRMRSLSKNVRRSQNLSSCKELTQERMTLREKGSHSVPGDQVSSQEFPPQTYPETIQTSTCSASDAINRSPDGPGFSTSIDDSCSVSSTSTSFTPKLVKSSPSELSNTSCRNTSARTPSLGSPQGLDLCDGLDTPFNLIHAQKLDESVSSPRSVRRVSQLIIYVSGFTAFGRVLITTTSKTVRYCSYSTFTLILRIHMHIYTCI